MTTVTSRTFSGRRFSSADLVEIKEVLDSCSGLSRTELAKTICELLEWTRPSGTLKSRECLEFLEQIDSEGIIRLPDRRQTRPFGSTTRIQPAKDEESIVLAGSVEQFDPVRLEQVGDRTGRDLWRGMVERHHYLGYKVPFGASLSYFIRVSRPTSLIVGCMQFSSPAWRMEDRDQWIGWDDERRGIHLQRLVSNSRFLILPGVRVQNLASAALAEASRILPGDWEMRYGVRPVLLETLVDGARFSGTCYRAANWLEVGMTSGRGRMDRANELTGMAPKKVFLMPLAKDFRQQLGV
ncbi:MAG: DUF4338 domain-containing protein [Magnetococcales bacterium]|nr:DUF4338 domain-containing protein [Magnetococcales bacterium]